MAEAGSPRAEMARAAALYGEGRLDEARAAAERIAGRDPRFFPAQHLLAAIAARCARWEDAVRFATRAIALDGSNAEALANRGAALRALHRFEEALADYDRALGIDPASAAAHHNRGVALAALNRHGEALQAFDASLRLRPDNAQARYARGLSRLMRGDFAGGWEDHEWRWAGSENAAAPRRFPMPMLEAKDLARAGTVAVWTEQGIGDQLLFMSLLPDLQSRGASIVLEVDPRLAPAVSRAHPDWRTVARPAPDAPFAGCDRHVPLGSLPRLLRPDAGSFGLQPRRLLAGDAARVAQFRARIDAGAARAVGLSWRSFQPASRSYYERRKNAPLAAFLPLSAAPGVRLVDLQYGDTREERAAFASAGGALASFDDLDRFGDLDGLLALIEACDAVVTTSNVTAHLAGALGKRTLLAYPGANPPFHYWVPDAQGRSRWYPSVEIVTDAATLSWDAVVARLREAL